MVFELVTGSKPSTLVTAGGTKIKDLISNVLSDEHKNKEFQPDHLLELMSSDKKRKGNQLNFVLLNSIGSAEVCSDIDDREILNSIKLT